MTKLIIMLATSSIVVSSAMAAQIRAEVPANGERYRAEYGAAPWTGFDRQRGCIKACDADSEPCDPVVFKRADGRCSLQ